MPTDPPFRMTIVDVFTIRGRGTVVTGQIETGTVQVGDTIEIRGQTGVKRTVVTSIETFRRLVDQAGEGENAGLFLQDVTKDEVRRGDVLVGAEHR